MLFCHVLPRTRLQFFHANGNAPLLRLGVDLEHLDFNLLSYSEHIRRFVDPSPRYVPDMQQSVQAAEIDEGAVIADTANSAAHRFAHPNLGVPATFGSALSLFANAAAGDYHTFAGHLTPCNAAA